jgi:molybdenum cofactor cytidylyltransferase
MLSSVKVGINNLRFDSNAALIVLGDQPQIEVEVVRKIIVKYDTTNAKIIVPSYKMHRGHPWLIDRYFWGEIIDLNPLNTLREFINKHQDTITYVNVDTPSILEDLDTPEDYLLHRP